jgi:uroporphyrinogen decarboxylase
MGEYQKIRRKHGFLKMCKTPELASEITMQPIKAFGFDAAILFSDILIPVEAMDVDLEFIDGKGPVLMTKIGSSQDVDLLRVPEPSEDLNFVLEAIKILRKKLEVPLIGFSGAPFTLASYMIEGGSSKSYLKTKAIMYNEPEIWDALMGKLSKTVIEYLNAQIDAGAQAVQVFDSWIGCLSPNDYDIFVKPHMKKIFNSIRGDVPVIHFGTLTSSLLELMSEAGGDVLGADWRINIDDAWSRIGFDRGIQGNLDPTALFAGPDELVKQVRDILERVGGRPGHIFNLGHGILPTTPVENVRILVETVRKFSST